MRFASTTSPTRSHTVLTLLGAALVPAVLVLALTCASMSGADENVRLSSSVARPPAEPVSPIVDVRLSRQGEVTIAGQAAAQGNFAAAWQRERAALRLQGYESSQATVALHADADVPTEAVQQLIEQAQRAGFQKCVLRE